MNQKIDYQRLYSAHASRLYDTSKPTMIYRFKINPHTVVFGPIQYISTSLKRLSGCPILRTLAIESLANISNAQRIEQ